MPPAHHHIMHKACQTTIDAHPEPADRSQDTENWDEIITTRAEAQAKKATKLPSL
jgi:hypothetical protein